MPDMTLADAVRSIARLKPMVASGMLGAAVACTLAVGAMAAERPVHGFEEREVNVLEAETDMHRVAAEFYARGVLSIARADFSKMSPRDAVSTMKSMARATLDAGPELPDLASTNPYFRGDGDGRVVAALVRTDDASKGASVVRGFLERLTTEAVLSPAMAREEAVGAVSTATRYLKAAGIEIQTGGKPFAGVEAEMRRAVELKVDALRRIASLGDTPDADPVDSVEAALSGETTLPPALNVLLGRLTADAVQDPGVSDDARADLVRGMAIRQAADGAFGAIVQQAREDGVESDTRKMARIATAALESIDRLQTAGPKETMSLR